MPKSKKKEEGPLLEGRRRGANTGLHYAFCNGKIVVGSDWKNVLGTTFLICAPVGIFFGFEANAVGRSISWAVVAVIGFLTLLSLATLYCTAFIDPGFVPRDPETQEPDEMHMTKEHVVNGYTVQTKWCTTCNHYRPPRCSHCAACDNCVQKFDHHCPWVGTCVGERNYPFFLAFLFTTTALDCLVFAFAWVRLAYLVNNKGMSWKQAVKHEPANVALMIYTFFFFFFVGGLAALHVFFTTQNVTTYEHFRSRYNAQGNPYDKGLFRNWATVCCHLPPKRLKETLPFRKVEDVLEDPLQGGHRLMSVDRRNGPEQHLNGSVELSMMEEGQASRPSPPVAGQHSLVTTAEYSDISEDGASLASGQRRIPMVNNLGTVNRTLLDSSDSDFSGSEIDHIRSHHSVMVLHDDNAGGSPVSAPSTSGDRRLGVEDTARLAFAQEGTTRNAEGQAEYLSEDPSRGATSGQASSSATHLESLEGGRARTDGGFRNVWKNEGLEERSEQQETFQAPTSDRHARPEEAAIAAGPGPSDRASPEPLPGRSLEEGIAEASGASESGVLQLPGGFQLPSAQEAQSDDETQYGSPRALSVWPSTDVESFRTAGSTADSSTWPTSRQPSSASLIGLNTPARQGIVKEDQQQKDTDPKPTPAHYVGTKGEPEQVTRN